MRSTSPSWRTAEIAELLALQPRLAGSGAVVFLAGEAGSGRSDLLRDVAERFHRAEPRPFVLAGGFVNGGYVPWEDAPAIAPGALGAIESVLSLSAPLLPIAGLAGQAISASRAAWRLVADVRARGERPELTRLLPSVLRAAAEEHPLVCLVDDADRAESGWWADLVLTFGQEIAGELPLLLVLAVDGPAELGPHAPEESEALYVARRLHARGLARWLALRPLGVDELGSCAGPAAREALVTLHDVTGGNAAWAQRLWADWQRRGVVERADDGRWLMASAHREQALVPLRDLFAERLTRLAGSASPAVLDPLRALLACAALEGREFTGDAVALATGLPRDAAIDLLDDVLSVDAAPDGLVVETDGIDVAGPQRLWRYRFRSSLDWLTLRRYGLADAERPAGSLALAEALEHLYGADTEHVARALAELFSAAGSEARAAHYRRVNAVGMRRDVILWRARRLVASPPAADDMPARHRAVPLLIAAAEILVDVGPLGEALAAAQAAVRVAPAQSQRAYALYLAGAARLLAGDLAGARTDHVAALRLARALNDRDCEATVLHELAANDLAVGRWEAALAGSEQARDLFRAIGGRVGEGYATVQLASICTLFAEYDRARAELGRALEIFEQARDPLGILHVRSELADVARLEGKHEEARAGLQAVRELGSELGDRQYELAARYLLAVMDISAGELDRAGAELEHLRTLYREFNDVTGEANVVYSLAKVARERGDHDAARTLCEDALARHRAIGDRSAEAHALYLLAQISIDQQDAAQARRCLVGALALYDDIGDPVNSKGARAAIATLDGGGLDR